MQEDLKVKDIVYNFIGVCTDSRVEKDTRFINIYISPIYYTNVCMHVLHAHTKIMSFL